MRHRSETASDRFPAAVGTVTSPKCCDAAGAPMRPAREARRLKRSAIGLRRCTRGIGGGRSVRARAALVARAGWLAVPLLLCACGTKGPPRPPLSKAPEPVQNLLVRQSGPSIEVRWSRPSRRTDGAPIVGPLIYEVLARARDRAGTTASVGPGARGSLFDPSGDRADQARAASDEFSKAATVVVRLAEPGASLGRPEAPVEPAAGSGPFHVTLGPERFPGSRLPSVRLAVGVVARDASGLRSRPGTIVEIDPVPPLPPLESFTASGTREGIGLAWRVPAAPGPVGVNIYRRPAASDLAHGFPAKPILGSPFAGDSARDASAQLGAAYLYEARLASTAPGRGSRESLPVTASIEYADRFPPGAPSLLTAEVVPADGARVSPLIRLRWSSPIDADVAGYRIYRGDVDGAPMLCGQVVGAVTLWEDAQVVPALRYHYTVTAIDGASPPNESERSETVDVEVPAGAPPGGQAG